MRIIKFNAYIPKLKIILHNVDVYGNGQMGCKEDESVKVLPEGYELEYDYGSVIRNYINKDGGLILRH